MKKEIKIAGIVTVVNFLIWTVLSVLEFLYQSPLVSINNDGFYTGIRIVENVLFLVVPILTVVFVVGNGKLADKCNIKRSILNKIVFFSYCISHILFGLLTRIIANKIVLIGEDPKNLKYTVKDGFGNFHTYYMQGDMSSFTSLIAFNIVVPFTIVFVFLLVCNFVNKWKMAATIMYSDTKLGTWGHRVCIILYSLLLVMFIGSFVIFGFRYINW